MESGNFTNTLILFGAFLLFCSVSVFAYEGYYEAYFF